MDPCPDRDSLKELLQQAVLAPSSHNTQPWCFHLAPGVIDLHADFSRALPVNDPDNRELHISCGCILFNLRVAAANAGWSVSIQWAPEKERPSFLARIQLNQGALEHDLALLFDAMLLRRTYRNRFRDIPLAPEVQESLQCAARVEGAAIERTVSDIERQGVIDLIREGDSRQWQNNAWRQELAQWLQGGRKGDGLTVPGLVAPLVRGVVRHFDIGKSVASQDSLLAQESPTLLLLSTADDDPRSWVQAGQALQRLLLEAQRQGIQASYLNQPIQVAELRPQLQPLFAFRGHAQILMRMGYPDEILPASPRRPVEAVIAE